MTTKVMYPSLTDLLPIDRIPDSLSTFKEGLTNIFSKLYYRNFYRYESLSKHVGNYNLDLVSFTRLALGIPGTNGFALVLNPDYVEGTDYSVFSLSIAYHCEILKYLNGFKLNTFGYNIDSIFKLLLSIANIDENELLNELLFGENAILSAQEFVNSFNTKYSTTITLSTDQDNQVVLNDLLSQIEASDFIIIDIIFNDYIQNTNFETAFSNIQNLFYKWFKSFTFEDFINILIPEISASINDITLALEFPNDFLQPVDSSNKAIAGKKSMLRFDVGSLQFSSNNGFEFKDLLTTSFDRSAIANTGLILSFLDAKIDLSKTSNIPEATAAGYSDDFVGVFVGEAEIDLPAKWNHDKSNPNSAVIKGRNILIGSGGFSGTIAMEGGDGLIRANFGNFEVELKTFSITFLKNAVTACSISGTMSLANFKDTKGDPSKIEITISFDANGNFEISAIDKVGIPLYFENYFTFFVKELSIGETDGDFYIETSGTLTFKDSTISNILSGDFELKKLRIWETGKIEIEGGTFPLPNGGINISMGPANLFITAIHFGSIQRTVSGVMRKYNYFGFDGGVDVNPGGVDVRGTGIKYCYSADSSFKDSYISIDSINISMIIPGDSDPEDATVLINGWLSVSQEKIKVDKSNPDAETQVYAGGIDIILPQVEIAAHAEMKYAPDVPAWIVDIGLELPCPIPLGPTGLGIYGFRGLVGQRYVATKEAAGLTDSATWFDYYKAPPTEGVDVRKFEMPEQSAEDSTPFSVGAGVSLATSADDGKAFSSKLFLLLSLPEVILFEGKANILGTRVGLTGEDPPFFAYLAITSESIETGFGLSYKLPKDSGDILDFYVQMEAAFFFNNPKAWYIHFGTKDKPIQGHLLSFLTGQVYLMLSAQGIETGASIEFDFSKRYLGGALSADVKAYIKTGGYISFHRPQIGAYASVGGSVNVSIFGFGFFLGFDTSLSVEAPKPFLITGSVTLQVGFKILWKKISKKFTVEFTWRKLPAPNPEYIIPLDLTGNGVKAINILSNETFDVLYLNNYDTTNSTTLLKDLIKNSVHPNDLDNTIIPMDSYIDIEFIKPLDPSKVTDKIGSVGTYTGNTDSIPPQKVNYVSTHQYRIDDIGVFCWNGTSWEEYFPYQAMINPDAIPADQSQIHQLGHWQIHAEGIYNRIRLLAQSPFSYMEPGLSGWCNPAQYGITPSSLFCVGQTPIIQEADWGDSTDGTAVWSGTLNSRIDTSKSIHYQLLSGTATISHISNIFNIAESLCLSENAILCIRLIDQSTYVKLKLYTVNNSVDISYYTLSTLNGRPNLNLVKSDSKSRYDLLQPLVYRDANVPIDYIFIQPKQGNNALITSATDQIESLTTTYYENNGQNKASVLLQITGLKNAITSNQELDSGALDKTLIQQKIDTLSTLLTSLTNDRIAAINEISRLQLLFDTAIAKMQNCCNIMMSPPQSSERLSCINSLKDIVPPGILLEDEQSDYDAYIASLQILSDGMVSCRISYTSNIAEVCNKAHTYTGDIQTKINDKKKTIDTIDEQLADTIDAINDLNKLLQSLPLPDDDGTNVNTKNTIIHSIEWITAKDYQQTINQAGKDAVQKSYSDTVQAITDSLAPVWRPETKYVLALKVTDVLNYDSSSPNTCSKTFMYGFKTAGPVGFFHEEYNTINPTKKYAPEDNLNLYKLTTLRDYIDYQRSYPNADGNILGAKPLYYRDTELNMYYVKGYVYHLFSNWPTYDAMSSLAGNLQVIVKDPIEELEIPNPLPPNVVSTFIPSTIVNWNKDDNATPPKGVKIVDIMRNPNAYDPSFPTSDGYCWSTGGQKIRPAWISTNVTFNFLNPSKLYTAIFYNVFGTDVATASKREIHRFVFQTSRYGNLEEQVKSYLINDDKGNQIEAIFKISLALSSTQITQISSLLAGNKTETDLDLTYTDPFDCLIQGVLQLSPLPPALNTEINRVINSITGKLIGLLIRNPEPFVDPKIPDVQKKKFCSIFKINSTATQISGQNQCLYSKDCSQIFITDITGLELNDKKIRLQFKAVKWDGHGYVDDTNNQYSTNTIIINE